MAGQPITPRFMADTVLMTRLDINYKQVWDGAAWVLDPTTIEVRGKGHLSENGLEVAMADITMMASDLPAAGQTALQDLYNYLEGEMATKYG